MASWAVWFPHKDTWLCHGDLLSLRTHQALRCMVALRRYLVFTLGIFRGSTKPSGVGDYHSGEGFRRDGMSDKKSGKADTGASPYSYYTTL